MVVVPALTKGQQRHPKAVPGIIVSAKAPSSPHMRGGVDEPGGVEPNDRTKEDAPENPTPPAHEIKQTGQYRDRHPMPAADPHLEAVFTQLGHIWQKLRDILLHGLTGENPAHMGPKTTIMGRMWIALFIGVLMMHAMGCNPE